MLLAVDLSIMADIPSGPVALEVSRQDRKKWTSSSVHSRSSGMVWSALKIELLGKRGGTARLKHVEKKSLSMFNLLKDYNKRDLWHRPDVLHTACHS